MKRIITKHTIRSPRIPERLLLAVAPDIHSSPYRDVLDTFAKCDAVLIPGDLVDRHRRDNSLAMRFLEEVPGVAPVFYSMGNHEVKIRNAAIYMDLAEKNGVTLLRDESTLFRGIRLGGLSSRRSGPPDLEFLDRFETEPEFRLLLCHQPEVWRDWVKGRNIDFTVCGHAHGGQIQLFGRGLFAPGQGIFPRLTHGIHDGGRMIVSRGMTNNVRLPVPRINNPCELIILNLERTE